MECHDMFSTERTSPPDVSMLSRNDDEDWETWMADAKRMFGDNSKRWVTSIILSNYTNKHSVAIPDTDELLMASFPREAFRKGATSFDHFSERGRFGPLGKMWLLLWSAIGLISSSGTKLEVFVECVDTEQQVIKDGPFRPTLSTDSYPPYPSLDPFLNNLEFYNAFARRSVSLRLEPDICVREYRVWIITKKDELAKGLDSCLRPQLTQQHLPSPSSFHLAKTGAANGAVESKQQAMAPIQPLVGVSVGDWFEAVKSYHHGIKKIETPVVQDELSQITESRSQFNPCVVFSVGSTWLPYAGTKGELDFPCCDKVLMIPGSQRNEVSMAHKFLPEYQKKWSDPILFASICIPLSTKAEHSRLEKIKLDGMEWTNGKYVNQSSSGSDIEYRDLAEFPFVPPSPIPIYSPIDVASEAEDGEHGEELADSQRDGMSLKVLDKYKILQEQRISRAISSIATRLGKRFVDVASAICFRFMTTEFLPNSPNTSEPLRVAAVAYRSDQFCSVRLTLVNPGCGKGIPKSAFASFVSGTAAGLKAFLDIPKPCIPNIMLLLAFRGRAYTIRRGLAPSVLLLGATGIGKSCSLQAFAHLCLPNTITNLTRSSEQSDTSNTNDVDFIRMEEEKYLGFADCVGGAVHSREATEKAVMDSSMAVVRRYNGGITETSSSICSGLRVCSANLPASSPSYMNRFCCVFVENQRDAEYVPSGHSITLPFPDAREFVKGARWIHMCEIVINKLIDRLAIPEACLMTTRYLIRGVNMVLKRKYDANPGRRIPMLGTYQVQRVMMVAQQNVIKQALAMLYGVSPSVSSFPTSCKPPQVAREQHGTCNNQQDPHALYGKSFSPEDVVRFISPWMKDSEEIAAFSMGILRDEIHGNLESRVFSVIRSLCTDGSFESYTGCLQGKRVSDNHRVRLNPYGVELPSPPPFRSLYDDDSSLPSEGTNTLEKGLIDPNYVCVMSTRQNLCDAVFSVLSTQASAPMRSSVESLLIGMCSSTVSDHPRIAFYPRNERRRLLHARDVSKPRKNYVLMLEVRKGGRSPLLRIHSSVFEKRNEGEDMVRDAILEVLSHDHAREEPILYGQPASLDHPYLYSSITPVNIPTKRFEIDTPSYVLHDYNVLKRIGFSGHTWNPDCHIDDVVTKERLFLLGMNYNDESKVAAYRPSKNVWRTLPVTSTLPVTITTASNIDNHNTTIVPTKDANPTITTQIVPQCIEKSIDKNVISNELPSLSRPPPPSQTIRIDRLPLVTTANTTLHKKQVNTTRKIPPIPSQTLPIQKRKHPDLSNPFAKLTSTPTKEITSVISVIKVEPQLQHNLGERAAKRHRKALPSTLKVNPIIVDLTMDDNENFSVRRNMNGDTSPLHKSYT